VLSYCFSTEIPRAEVKDLRNTEMMLHLRNGPMQRRCLFALALDPLGMCSVRRASGSLETPFWEIQMLSGELRAKAEV